MGQRAPGVSLSPMALSKQTGDLSATTDRLIVAARHNEVRLGTASRVNHNTTLSIYDPYRCPSRLSACATFLPVLLRAPNAALTGALGACNLYTVQPHPGAADHQEYTASVARQSASATVLKRADCCTESGALLCTQKRPVH